MVRSTVVKKGTSPAIDAILKATGASDSCSSSSTSKIQHHEAVADKFQPASAAMDIFSTDDMPEFCVTSDAKVK